MKRIRLYPAQTADALTVIITTRFPLGRPVNQGISSGDLWRTNEASALDIGHGLPPNPEAVLQQFLGSKCYRRLNELRRSKAGWNQGKGEPLSEGSVKACLNLAYRLPSLGSKVSLRLYLSEQGGLNLVWDTSANQTKMIRCLPEGYFVFNEELGLEKPFVLTDAYDVLLATGLAPISLGSEPLSLGLAPLTFA
jgi:hypothetical protein